MSTTTIYTGPGKTYYNAKALQAEAVNGQIKMDVKNVTTEIANAMFGRVGEVQTDLEAEITTKPFSDWLLLPTLYPTYLGVSTNGNTGALLIGTIPFTGSPIPTLVYGNNGSSYSFVRTAITKHPSLTLAPDKPMFGDITITAIGGVTAVLGASAYLMSATPILEPGFATDANVATADPGGAASITNFVQDAWTGAWGAVSGYEAIQAEDGWTVDFDVKYSAIKLSGRTIAYKLDSVSVMAKCRPFGITHSALAATMLAYAQGAFIKGAAATNLVLTSILGKTITLNNCAPRGVGFEFGGTGLNTGEIGFVTQTTFTAGIAQPFIVFSA